MPQVVVTKDRLRSNVVLEGTLAAPATAELVIQVTDSLVETLKVVEIESAVHKILSALQYAGNPVDGIVQASADFSAGRSQLSDITVGTDVVWAATTLGVDIAYGATFLDRPGQSLTTAVEAGMRALRELSLTKAA